MPKIFTNDFSWSVTRASAFQRCQRAYYYTYYGSWNGWKREAPELTRKIYQLKQIKTLPMWAGTIVHDTIKETLEAYARQETQFPTPQVLQEIAVAKLRSGWTESVSKRYLQVPKSTNLFELYYGNGKTLPRETTDAVKKLVLDCLDNFASSPVVFDIRQTPVSQWKPIDTLDSFYIDDIKVWGAPDFAYMDNQGDFHIIDWKTGIEKKDALGLQLACYALFSMDKWHVENLERIKLHGVFLRDGGRKSNYPLSAENLISAKDTIMASAHAMKAKCISPATNEVEEENCPCNVSPDTCQYCVYREICPAVNGLL